MGCASPPTMATTLSCKLQNMNLEETKDEIDPPEGHLTFRYMFEHEPFEILPFEYFPWKEVDHYPPIFDYGIALTTEEIQEYARREVFLEGRNPHDYRDVLHGALRKLNKEFGLEPGGRIGLGVPYSKMENVVLFKFLDNYVCPLSDEKVHLVVDGLKRAFGKEPQWFLSHNNEEFKNNYNVPDWKIDRWEAQLKKEGEF
ncbi:hypothetical protein E1B28_006973 [Marasmius oreades]|uniref:Uncharacterized protein n=1 Tax=Marasmius oreades TaxID=181124 RepID=A0A9P7S217_9AGAR|nr:uncharacterized protein E1B28_006973 [Marasmius oreades]KAG7093291.1 hypothetical protein E1B28_006973 [Marasmius oreades]